MDVATSTYDLAVIGLGYVGLPLAHEATRVGLRVAGLDVSTRVVEGLTAGRSHIDDLSEADVAAMREAGFQATTDPAVLAQANTVVICVPTPLSAEGGPDLGAVTAAARSIAAHLRPGTLVILESTTYPGTTEEVVRPILEESGLVAGEDFHLAFSPERIDPGNPTFGVANTPKVVGGLTETCGATAAAFYGKFVQTVVQARGTREAEMAKLLENTYRHVNIALVNEMAIFCQELDVDLWDAIACAATKPFGFQAFYPGPGVGGHCIPIDPNYLSYKVKTLGYPFRFVELAQEINARMPSFVLQRAQEMLNDAGLALSRSKVLLLGVTYKADIADQRESPARPVARKLAAKGAHLTYHDPHVAEWSVNGEQVERATDLERALAEADLAILLTDHREYRSELLTEHARMLLDTRGVLRRLAPEGPSDLRTTASITREGVQVL
ncbi:nucleotide sugar dehydrogenase [Marinitenerispora sediminis]|uniref:Nucleotide sugar dehydrogenase n=1 Tax=Marinitenerispora sediminis TaxID=1931232 RepID=A0A368T8S1_9ACTN|nr:nucleotide sugar dehydrogenase [Marinitenerispora sediminis]RCV54328.1 nucleotide sugar dehydrogenase [Marinitenerispora sediminis]RCV60498.1 nucleotide sugar dehydrogenase [Marinitenerispora sediminis]RCV61050.1 nucleotide sugar dehydrogenase [Marinitenerispora sediminis]